MIALEKYAQFIKDLGTDKLNDAQKEAHSFIVEYSDNLKDYATLKELMSQSADIKDMVESYLSQIEKLEAPAPSSSPKPATNPKPKEVKSAKGESAKVKTIEVKGFNVSNLSQLKKSLIPGLVFYFTHTGYADQTNVKRTVKSVNSRAVEFEREDGKSTWLDFPSANKISFSDEGFTIDFGRNKLIYSIKPVKAEPKAKSSKPKAAKTPKEPKPIRRSVNIKSKELALLSRVRRMNGQVRTFRTIKSLHTALGKVKEPRHKEHFEAVKAAIEKLYNSVKESKADAQVTISAATMAHIDKAVLEPRRTNLSHQEFDKPKATVDVNYLDGVKKKSTSKKVKTKRPSKKAHEELKAKAAARRSNRKSKGMKGTGKSITDNPNFKRWFGNSVVTVDGKPGSEPLIMYHGTNADFTEFKDNEPFTRGFWFTSDRKKAEGYGNRVIEAYISDPNPEIHSNVDEGSFDIRVKNASQIKSVTNNGKFDKNSPSMIEGVKPVRNEKPAKAAPQLSGVMSGSAIMASHFETLPFNGLWADFMQHPGSNLKLVVYGKPKNGKTSLCFQFADYISAFGQVLYVLADQGIGAATKQLIQDMNIGGNPNVLFAATREMKQLEEWVKSGRFQFVFIDLVNNFEVTAKQFEAFMHRYPNTGFVLVMESTKKGDFRGEQTWTHIVDAIVNVENFVAHNSGRYGYGDFVIWPERVGEPEEVE